MAGAAAVGTDAMRSAPKSNEAQRFRRMAIDSRISPSFLARGFTHIPPDTRLYMRAGSLCITSHNASIRDYRPMRQQVSSAELSEQRLPGNRVYSLRYASSTPGVREFRVAIAIEMICRVLKWLARCRIGALRLGIS